MRVLDIVEEGLVALRPELDAAARHARLEQLTDPVGQRIAIARALSLWWQANAWVTGGPGLASRGPRVGAAGS